MRLLSAAALLLTPVAFAQGNTAQSATATAAAAPRTHIILTAPASNHCPVVAAARRWSAGAVQQVRDPKSPASANGGVTLQASSVNQPIASIVAVVRGPGLEAHAEPAQATNGPHTGDLSERFHLTAANRNAEGLWTLTPGTVPLVREVDLIEIHFTDGTTWHQSAEAFCHIQPNGFLRVTN